MATHSSILVWKIPWTAESGGLQSMGLQRVRHDWEHTHARTNLDYDSFTSCPIFCLVVPQLSFELGRVSWEWGLTRANQAPQSSAGKRTTFRVQSSGLDYGSSFPQEKTKTFLYRWKHICMEHCIVECVYVCMYVRCLYACTCVHKGRSRSVVTLVMAAKIPTGYHGAGHVPAVGLAICLFVQRFITILTQAFPGGKGEDWFVSA